MKPAHPIRLLVICLCLLPCLAAATDKETSNSGRSTATTTRDAWGIPSIKADTITDVYEEYGYVMAVDRLWQFETNRRFSQGRLAEIYGPQLVPADMQTLLLGYSNAEYQAIFETLSPQTQILIRAYVKGVNRRVNELLTNPSSIPLEFQTLNITPVLFDELDIMAFATALMRRFGFLGGGEFDNLAVIEQLNEKFGEKEAAAIFDDLMWINDPDAPTYVKGDFRTDFVPGSSRKPAVSVLNNDINIVNRVASHKHQSILASAQAQRIGAPLQFGSLSWTLSSKKTGTGYPIHIGQPQMGYMVPNMFAEVHLQAETLNVYGLTVPLFPGMSIGHNTDIAWSHMVGMGDSVDIYTEKLNPENRSEYWYDGRWKKMESREVTVNVRGEAEPRKFNIYRTVHGPVFSPVAFDPAKSESNIAYSKKMVHWMREPLTLQGWMEINAASNFDEFSAGAEQIMSSLHSTYADIKGNIGYWHTGLVPERPGEFDPRFPMPGTGEAEWTGKYSPGIHVLNPDEEFIAGWNNKSHPSIRNPFPTNPNYHFGPYHRSQWITNAIQGARNLDLKANKQLIEQIAGAGTWMGNLHNGIGLSKQTLLPHLQTALKGALKSALTGSSQNQETVASATRVLEHWDGRSARDVVKDTMFQAGHVIYQDWISRLIKATFQDELGSVHQFAGIDNVLLALLFRSLQGNGLKIKNSRDYFDDINTTKTESQDDIFLGTFTETITHLTTQFDHTDTANWKVDRNKIEFKHDLFGKVAEMYDSNFGTYVQIVELRPTGAVGYSRWPLGQSSNISRGPDNKPVLDTHYLDMLQLYKDFQYREK